MKFNDSTELSVEKNFFLIYKQTNAYSVNVTFF